jgi:hypothetical protein
MKFILRQSNIPNAGIGVFTLGDIEPSQQLVLGQLSIFKKKSLSEIDDCFLKFCPMLEDEIFLCPESFHTMNVFWYINHSDTPNLVWTEGRLFSKRKVHSGEELTIFYHDLETHPKNIIWYKK